MFKLVRGSWAWLCVHQYARHAAKADLWEKRALAAMDEATAKKTQEGQTLIRIAGSAAHAKDECFAELASKGEYEIRCQFKGRVSVPAVGTALVLQGIATLIRSGMDSHTIDAIIHTSTVEALGALDEQAEG